MKKFISILLIAGMIFAMAACDKESSTKKDSKSRKDSKKEVAEESVAEESSAEEMTAPIVEEPTQLGTLYEKSFRDVMESHNCNVGSGDINHGEKKVLLASTSSYMTVFEYHLFNSESDAIAFFDEAQTVASNAGSAEITDTKIKWTTELNYMVVILDGDVVIAANTMAGDSGLASEMDGILAELGY